MDPDFYALATEYGLIGELDPAEALEQLQDFPPEAVSPLGPVFADGNRRAGRRTGASQASSPSRLSQTHLGFPPPRRPFASPTGLDVCAEEDQGSPTPRAPLREAQGMASARQQLPSSPAARRSLAARDSGNPLHRADPLVPVSALRGSFEKFLRGRLLNSPWLPMAARPYGAVFKFHAFNWIQSKCLPTVYETNHNVLVSAPTGSGKTVLFELAILRMFEYHPAMKAVYMAPTKSLCGERYRDWASKFSALNLHCMEFTGDTEHLGLSEVKRANVIITTPEKWDSMTRRWFELPKILNNLKLVCIDEVHMLNEERGSVLEVIVARMKTLGSNIRFLALSATVPNIEDVAEWLGDGCGSDKQPTVASGPRPAKVFVFGEDFRPVQLKKFVYSFQRRKEHSDFQFMSLLNHKLMDMILKHSAQKPTLIFCGTRKSSLQAAEALSKSYEKIMADPSREPPWRAAQNLPTFSDKRLTQLSLCGIGVHHAGLDQHDRQQMEALFLSQKLIVLCTTSTLAVGVNLPARCVIIRGTKAFKGAAAKRPDGFEDYTDLDLNQMMGRAGRPQFDTEGVVVIMTTQNDKERIEKMVNSQTMLESCLHSNLTEHVNTELVMKTIVNKETAARWISNSFLAVRIKKNPKHYSVRNEDLAPEKQLEGYVDETLKLLVKDGLTERDIESHDLRATELGKIMSKYSLRYKTFLNFIHLNPNETIQKLLEVISQADEYSTIRLRAGEGQVYKALNECPEVKFPLSKRVTQTCQKVYLLIQAILGGKPLNEIKSENANPQMECNMIWQHLPRMCKGALELFIIRKDITALNCLILLRSATAKAWDNTPWVLRQLDQIGEKSVKRLVESGITNIDQIRTMSEARLEMILDRNPPFGTRVLRQARSMPKFFCHMNTIFEEVTEDGVHVGIEVEVGLDDSSELTAWTWKNSALMATVFVVTSNQQWLEFRSIRVEYLVEVRRFTVECILAESSQNILTYVGCNQIAGIGCTTKWNATIPPERYPIRKLLSGADAATVEALDGLAPEDLESSGFDILAETGTSADLEAPISKAPVDGLRNNTEKIYEKCSHPAGREKLANGRYKCGHNCQSACNHQCCLYGVLKPPRSQKPATGNVQGNKGANDFESTGWTQCSGSQKTSSHCESKWVGNLKQIARHQAKCLSEDSGSGMVPGVEPRKTSALQLQPKSSTLANDQSESLPTLEEMMARDVLHFQEQVSRGKLSRTPSSGSSVIRLKPLGQLTAENSERKSLTPHTSVSERDHFNRGHAKAEFLTGPSLAINRTYERQRKLADSESVDIQQKFSSEDVGSFSNPLAEEKSPSPDITFVSNTSELVPPSRLYAKSHEVAELEGFEDAIFDKYLVDNPHEVERNIITTPSHQKRYRPPSEESFGCKEALKRTKSSLSYSPENVFQDQRLQNREFEASPLSSGTQDIMMENFRDVPPEPQVSGAELLPGWDAAPIEDHFFTALDEVIQWAETQVVTAHYGATSQS